jgi:hypothetical protein
MAKTSGLHIEDLRHILNLALAQRVFSEPSPGVIAHSAASCAMADVPFFHEWLAYVTDTFWPAATQVSHAMAKWPGSQEPSQTAFSLSRGTSLSFFDEIARHPAEAKRFADAMGFFQGSPGMRSEIVLDNYDWGALDPGATVVDVGGSHGGVAIELVKRFPSLRCVVQDRPEVIATAPPDAHPRVEFQAHDFFDEQPVRGADVYFLRWIFHDWSDAYCVRILRNLIPALGPKSRVVINDHVVPPPGILGPFQDRMIRRFDMVMKGFFNAKERNEEDWKKLLEEADQRFRIVDIKRPEGSQLQIIEVLLWQ